MNTTAEKYDVPYPKAVSHGPADLPPRTNPSTLLAFLRVMTPMPIMTAKKMIRKIIFTTIPLTHPLFIN